MNFVTKDITHFPIVLVDRMTCYVSQPTHPGNPAVKRKVARLKITETQILS
jgi:hypothetical protein